MNKLFALIFTSLVLALPLTGTAAPDESQRMLSQKTLAAKQKLIAAQNAAGAERQKLMQVHMIAMQDVTTQMQKARPGDGMSPAQNREWIDEHLKLMGEMMGQMMEQHHMISQEMPGRK